MSLENKNETYIFCHIGEISIRFVSTSNIDLNEGLI